jgi:hypothetical protein
MVSMKLQTNQIPTPKSSFELQIYSSDFQLSFYEKVPDQYFGGSSEHSTV